MSEESIDVESDRNDLCNHLNNFDSTYMKGDILAFARILDKKYAEKKSSSVAFNSSPTWVSRQTKYQWH